VSDLGLEDIIKISKKEKTSLWFNNINMSFLVPLLYNQKSREFLLTKKNTKKHVKNTLNKFVKYNMMVKNSDNLPAETTALRYLLGKTIVKNVISLYDKKDDEFRFSEAYRNKFPNAFLKNTFIEGAKRRNKLIKQGKQVPSFISIDPTSECNLNCDYCYADAGSKSKTYNNEKISYPDLRRIITEAWNSMGISFIVFSGGEPTMWKDKQYDKDITNIFEEFSDRFFIMFTNGTKLDDYLVKKISETGNVIPCISQEGPETSKRRGKGMDKIVDKTTQRLVDYGVPYFYSITLTSKNVDSIMTKEFFDYLFEDKKAMGTWLFQCMAEGRIDDNYKKTLEVLLSPNQREHTFKFNWLYNIIEKERFSADFWGSGAAAANKDCFGGCMAGGRNGGYFSIKSTKDKKVIPCLFCSIYDTELGSLDQIWDKGLDISAALESKTFKAIRTRQKDIIDSKRPCVVRDYRFVEYLINEGIAKPLDPGTERLFTDKRFLNGFRKISDEYSELCAKKRIGIYD